MDAVITELSALVEKKINSDEERELQTLLKETVARIPPVPLELDLQPITTYTEQEAVMSQRNEISSLLLGQFERNCHIRHYITLAARTFMPHQIDLITTPEIARHVIWSYDRGSIGELDLISYAFMLNVGSQTNSTHSRQFYDYQIDSVLDPINEFTESQHSIFNNLNSTLLALMTEIGNRRKDGVHKTFYRMLETAEVNIQINSLELNSTEELNFQQICEKTCHVTKKAYGQAYKLLEDENRQKRVKLKDVWTENYTQEQKDALDIALYCILCACLSIQKVQSYINEIHKLWQQQVRQQEKQANQAIKQQELVNELRSQEQQNSKERQFTNFEKAELLNRPGKIYRKFNELSIEQEDLIKFKATDNLYDYILLKKKLKLLLDDQLFSGENGGAEDPDLNDEEIVYQQELKQQELDEMLKKLHSNEQSLEEIRQLSNSYCMQAKTDDFNSLKNKIISRNASYQPINPNLEVVKTIDNKIPPMLAISLKEYSEQVQKIFFDEMMGIFDWSSVKKQVLSLVYGRAIYGGEVFGIESFADIIKYQEEDMVGGQAQDGTTDTEEEQSNEEEYKRSGKAPEQRRKEVEKQAESLERQLRGIRYTSSRMRLIIDNSIIGKSEATLCHFINYVSEFCRLVGEEENRSKQVIDFRNFTSLIAERVATGGQGLGFVPYIDGTNSFYNLLEDGSAVRTFTADEVASILICFWAMPVSFDIYPCIRMLLSRALGCNPVMRTVLSEMLHDLYVYLDIDAAELDTAQDMFYGE